jgi:hypothetical protein
MWEKKSACRILVGKPERKRALERPRLRWIFTKYEGEVEWINLAQDKDKLRALVKAVMNLRAP